MESPTLLPALPANPNGRETGDFRMGRVRFIIE